MRTPAFWYAPPGPLGRLLAPLGALYGRVTLRRMARPGVRAPLPVICVGNFVAGGAGKTPTAIALARAARDAGLSPCFLTRGYGGRLAGPLVVAPDHHGADEVGDEALLLARVAPTVVCRDRRRALDTLAGLGADLCILDDGFQNPAIEKQLSLVVVDGAAGVGNGLVLPAGPLRAPVDAQMARADAVVMIGDPAGESATAVLRAAADAGRPVLRARLAQRGVEAFRGRRVYAYAGLGRPRKFFDQLRDGGVDVVEARGFPDHHLYADADARAILARADALAALPVTTEKDAVRLAHAAAGPRAELAERSVVFAVDCVFEAPEALARLIETARLRWREGG